MARQEQPWLLETLLAEFSAFAGSGLFGLPHVSLLSASHTPLPSAPRFVHSIFFWVNLTHFFSIHFSTSHNITPKEYAVKGIFPRRYNLGLETSSSSSSSDLTAVLRLFAYQLAHCGNDRLERLGLLLFRKGLIVSGIEYLLKVGEIIV